MLLYIMSTDSSPRGSYDIRGYQRRAMATSGIGRQNLTNYAASDILLSLKVELARVLVMSKRDQQPEICMASAQKSRNIFLAFARVVRANAHLAWALANRSLRRSEA